MRFSDIAGHERIKSVLVRSFEDGHIGHAYIFEGGCGIGRLSAAKAFAQLLVCENPAGGEVCGRCKSCSMAASENHPDIQIVTNQLYDSTKKSADILVDTVRCMKRDIYIKPYCAERKIYIVPRADTMNVHAQNSLLKVLEEPPEYCTIILIAENSNLFLPTILSRAVLLKFSPLETEIVKDFLKKRLSGITDEEASAKACMSGGRIGRALELADDAEADALRKEIAERIVNLKNGDRRAIYDMTLFLKHKKERIDFIIDTMRDFFRDMIYVASGAEELAVNRDMLGELTRICGSAASVPLRLLETLEKYSLYFSRNISYAQTVQCMAMELWEVVHDRDYRS